LVSPEGQALTNSFDPTAPVTVMHDNNDTPYTPCSIDNNGMNVNVVAPVSTTIECQINNTSCTALVDTGSCVSLLASSSFPDLVPAPLTQSRLVSVNNDELCILGVVAVTVTLGPVSRQYEFLVAKCMSHDVILGSDFLSEHEGTIDFPQKSLFIQDDNFALPFHLVYGYQLM